MHLKVPIVSAILVVKICRKELTPKKDGNGAILGCAFHVVKGVFTKIIRHQCTLLSNVIASFVFPLLDFDSNRLSYSFLFSLGHLKHSHYTFIHIYLENKAS